MKILLIAFIVSLNSFACKVSQFNSCRDGGIEYFSAREIRKSLTHHLYRYPKATAEIEKIFSKAPRSSSSVDLFNSLLHVSRIEESFNRCLQYSTEVDSCLVKAIKPAIVFGYKHQYLDATSSMILMENLKVYRKTGKEKIRLSLYSNKIRLNYKSYKKRQGENVEASPLNHQKYFLKQKELGKISPRQHTLLKYNYPQLKIMADMLLTFDKRVNALEGGLYFRYSDEEVENISLDNADVYRMTVKLLLRDLKIKGSASGVFEGKQPKFHDLIVAASELGYLNDKVLSQMLELPYLYEKPIPKWKKALKITWDITKATVPVIPGVGLYSIIPIVLVESYLSSREKKDEVSDLHIITFN
jgi:hypothetical protein